MTPAVAVETTERFGRPFRHFQVAVSAGAMALAWARQEDAPHGATVVVDREVSPLGRLGRLWATPPESTLACAVVLRPRLPAEDADLAWLMAGLVAAEGGEAVSGRSLSTWWPDAVIDAESTEEVAVTRAEAQLGPGQVRSAIITLRLDLERLGVGPGRRDELLEAVMGAVDHVSEQLGESDGALATAAAYDRRCRLVGRRMKVRLLPKGETRGVARRVDRAARLELESGTGMIERISVDMLREFELV